MSKNHSSVLRKPSWMLLLLLSCSWGLQAADTTRVLFIGNSVTYFNDMPQMVQEIARSKGKTVAVEMYAPGGTGFVNHYTDPNVYSLFRSRQWNVVVLQPGTSESAGVSFPVNTTIQRGRVMLDSIYRYSPCTQVYLYEIPYGVPSPSTYATYFSIQTKYRDSVTKMADSLRLQMVPAGECARAYYEKHPNLLLHGSYNDIHPNANGSFLTALAMYAAIFQDTVSGSGYYASVQPDTARKFFSIVDTVVFNHLSDWRINRYNLKAGFGYTVSAGSVSFTNTGANYSSTSWSFGDNTSSAAANPIHHYAASGTYTVTQKLLTTAGCADSVSKQITVVVPVVTVNGNADSGFVKVYPNPAGNFISLRGGGVIAELVIFNSQGQRVLSSRQSANIPVAHLSAGVYFIQVRKQDKIYTARFVKGGH